MISRRTTLVWSLMLTLVAAAPVAGQKRRTAPSRTPTAPTVSRVTPTRITVAAGDRPMTVTLYGSGLEAFTSAHVEASRRTVPGVTGTIQQAGRGAIRVTLTAAASATNASGVLVLTAGRRSLTVTRAPVTIAALSATRVRPGSISLEAGGPAGTVQVEGAALGRAASAQVISRGAPDGRFSVSVSRRNDSAVDVRVTAGESVPAGGNYSIAVIVDGVRVSVPATILVVEPAPSLEAVTLSSPSIEAGENTSGTVSLARPAPKGGTTVGLQVNSSDAGVPTSVTIPSGGRAAIFSVSSGGSGAPSTVTITARLGVTSRSVDLEIRVPPPSTPALIGITTAPQTVEPGGSVGVSVALGAPAPTDVLVALQSSNAGVLRVPAEVVVRAGTDVASIQVEAGRSDGSATLSATLDGVELNASVTVQAPLDPIEIFAPRSLDAGTFALTVQPRRQGASFAPALLNIGTFSLTVQARRQGASFAPVLLNVGTLSVTIRPRSAGNMPEQGGTPEIDP